MCVCVFFFFLAGSPGMRNHILPLRAVDGRGCFSSRDPQVRRPRNKFFNSLVELARKGGPSEENAFAPLPLVHVAKGCSG